METRVIVQNVINFLTIKQRQIPFPVVLNVRKENEVFHLLLGVVLVRSLILVHSVYLEVPRHIPTDHLCILIIVAEVDHIH